MDRICDLCKNIKADYECGKCQTDLCGDCADVTDYSMDAYAETKYACKCGCDKLYYC